MGAASKRKTAICVFIAVVIIFSLLGCHLSLSRACRNVEKGFFVDETDSPAAQLSECVKLSNRILSVINGVLDDSLYDELYNARIALDEALTDEDIEAVCEENEALTEAVDAVEAAAEGISFDSTEDMAALLSDFDGAQRMAGESDYNDTVDEFMEDVANRFPTNILRRLAFVDMPERFE